MSDETATKATLGGRREGRGKRFALSALIAVLFGALFAWDVWEAIGNLVGLRLRAAQLGTDLSPTGWTTLLLQLAAPLVLYVIALVLGRQRGYGAKAALLLVGLCVSAVIAADLQSVFGPATLFDLG